MADDRPTKAPTDLADLARAAAMRLGHCHGVIGGMTPQFIAGLLRDLADALDAATADSERLDWIEAKRMDLDFVTHGHRSPPGWRVWGPRPTDIPYGTHAASCATAREAIDEARAGATARSLNPEPACSSIPHAAGGGNLAAPGRSSGAVSMRGWSPLNRMRKTLIL